MEAIHSHKHTVVSVVIPVFNGAAYLEECLTSIEGQTILNSGVTTPDSGHHSLEIQISIYDDASNDGTQDIIRKWEQHFIQNANSRNSSDAASTVFTFSLISGRNNTGEPKGVGFSKNRAIEQSTGEFICFCDADDVMLPERIHKQLQLAKEYPDSIIGSQFIRIPEHSTRNYTEWANSLTQEQLATQIFSSFGPTVIMPTWFCHRSTFLKVLGGFTEVKSGNPEDLIYFYKHLDLGGRVFRADYPLTRYRFHYSSATFSVLDETIRNLRLERLETQILSRWSSFSIWNAGKLGRRFYRSLKAENQVKVDSFYDVDLRKIHFGYYQASPMSRKIPILNVRNASPPLIICVKTEITFEKNGSFQQILDELQLLEGIDFFFFN